MTFKNTRQIPQIEYSTFDDIAETRPVLLVTSNPAWVAVRNHLSLPVRWQTEAKEATLLNWQKVVDQVTLFIRDANQRGDVNGSLEVVYAVGGGLVVDMAKFIASKINLPLVCLPTALSADAFFNSMSGIHEGGCVQYIETKAPDKVVVDFGAIASAPLKIRSTGICDVLSIATATWDWEFAESRGMNTVETPYIPYITQVAKGILQGSLDCADAAGRGDLAGLKQLLDCMVLEVELCHHLGHSRVCKGSEHYFAYAVDNEFPPGLPHGDLVGPGILIMADLQEQDITHLWRAIEASHVNLHRIPQTLAETTLHKLPQYVREHNLPFGIAHTLSTSEVISLDDFDILIPVR
jgi:glycerol-1-phosphate dehydrogenase [NAD(P)+]